MPPLSDWTDDTLNGRPTRSWRPSRRSPAYHVAAARTGGRGGFVGLSVDGGRVRRLFTAEGELPPATPMLPQYLMSAEEAREACEHDHLDPVGSVLVPSRRAARRSNPISHVQYARVRGGLPWSEKHPLVFHTLTRAGHWPENRGFLEESVAANMAIAPASMRTAALGRVKPIDVEAGDDRFVFFSAAKPYRGDESHDPPWRGMGEITLAFDYDDLAARSPFGWRPHDLLHTYEVQAKRGWRRCPQMMRSTAPTSGPELLRKLADLATIFDPAVVRALVRLYLRFERQAGDSTAQRRTAREAMALCKPYVARFEEARKVDPAMRCVRERDVRFRSPFGVANVEEREEGRGPSSDWPDSLSWMFGPELLYGRPVPVADALFFYDPGTGRWFHMHELRLRMGQGKLPNV